MYDVFISYSRRDKPFVERLVRALEGQNRNVWVDFDDIPFATDWWEEICAGIENSRAVVFTLTPHSLESQVSGMEVNYAFKNNKRVIPIVFEEPKERSRIPQEIAALNWIFFKGEDQFDESLRQLLETVDNNIEAVRQHTQLLVSAHEWERHGHSPNLLLRGERLDAMEPMLQRDDLTDLQRDFLQQSLYRRRRAQSIQRFMFGFLGGLLGMGFWAFSVFRSAEVITPLRLIYTIALGEVFGLFIGLLALLSSEMPEILRQRVRPPVLLALRIAACLVIGVLAWAIFRWFYLQYDALTRQDVNALLFGGLGLSAGFIVNMLFRLPGLAAAGVMALLIYLPMLVTLESYFAGSDLFVPLVYFDDRAQIFTVGIPMVLLIAIGANAQALYHHVRVLLQRNPAPVKQVRAGLEV